ncbi:uncharacterized protein [Trachinotus anak]|uniref:uncharacterized protein n=1 Tax=Trachinotus anak TaxID=443729 RepID=UPI0039F244D8
MHPCWETFSPGRLASYLLVSNLHPSFLSTPVPEPASPHMILNLKTLSSPLSLGLTICLEICRGQGPWGLGTPGALSLFLFRSSVVVAVAWSGVVKLCGVLAPERLQRFAIVTHALPFSAVQRAQHQCVFGVRQNDARSPSAHGVADCWSHGAELPCWGPVGVVARSPRDLSALCIALLVRRARRRPNSWWWYFLHEPLAGNMEEEMQQLRELVSQLKADNERLRQERAASPGGSGGAASASSGPSGRAPAAGVTAAVAERLVVIPRDRAEGQAATQFLVVVFSSRTPCGCVCLQCHGCFWLVIPPP